MSITRSQIARQLMAEGGVSLDDAKRMAPEGEFLAYINPKEANMLRAAGGSGIMTPMGIPSFIDFGDYDAVAGAAAGGEFGGGSPEDTFGGGDNAPDAVTVGQPTQKTPVRDRVISGIDTVARFVFPTYGKVRGAMDISNFISRKKQPKVTNIVDEVALTKGRTPTVIPEGDSDTQIAQPIMPMMPLVPKLPSDIEPEKSDIVELEEFKQRFTLPERFRLANGGDVSVKDAEKMAPKGEFLAYINDDEAALLKSLGGAGKAINETGIPSFFVKKLFKKAAKAVKKVVKSDLGKAALAGAAIYGLGGGTFFGKALPGISSSGGFAFRNIAPNLFGVAGSGDFGGTKGILGNLKLTKGFGAKMPTALGAIVGATGLGAAAAGEEKEEDIDSLAGRISDETGIDVAQIRKEVQDAYAKGDLSGLRSKYPFLIPTGSAMAEGGIARLGFDNGGTPVFTKGSILKDKDVMRMFEDADQIKSTLSTFIEEERAPDVSEIMDTMKFFEKVGKRYDKTGEKIASREDFEEIDPYGTFVRDEKGFLKFDEKGDFITDKSKINPRRREPVEILIGELIMKKKEKEIDELDKKLVKMLKDKGLLEKFYENQDKAFRIMDLTEKYKNKQLAKQADADSMLGAFGYGEIKKANGGIARLGYQEGSPPTFAEGVKQKFVSDEAGAIPKKMKDGEGGVLPSDMGKLKRKDFESEEDYKRYLRQLNKKAEGGLMDLGGNEMDLRGGGFVPIGAKEKADDVPARLSKNEFVFTADAVRAAGGGSVEKGAQKMYNTMKQLEDSIA